ncbi:hypothetical protein TNCV_3512881 [Trichonephila clavipes]|nr:hypothetical protein TNCV_3512881 [Trichonephila clavipes]
MCGLDNHWVNNMAISSSYRWKSECILQDNASSHFEEVQSSEQDLPRYTECSTFPCPPSSPHISPLENIWSWFDVRLAHHP